MKKKFIQLFLLSALLLGLPSYLYIEDLVEVGTGVTILTKEHCFPKDSDIKHFPVSGISKDFLSYLNGNISVSSVAKSKILQNQAKAYTDRNAEYKKLKLDSLSSDEFYWNAVYILAKIIYAEGGNMDDEFQQKIGYVVLNRVESKYYPNSIREVFLSSGAYEETSIERFHEGFISDQAIKNSKIVLNHYLLRDIPYSPAMVYQSEFKQGINIQADGNSFFGEDPRIISDLEKNND